ncbi:hypothetical protein VFC49_09195 [Thermococcus sp. SY098]|uniref:hypothetical protein n=1 Tax=Thermococcus sp. SY098 TaxID=3111325 RepID=UPI002D7A056D|nr:hypothetical protein [Thermococcus sp. SY098]WRS52222.1 hypothetical protein VFC49_09195 [Thermococcus sp. SY098]
MQIYVDAEAYRILKELKAKLAEKNKFSEKDISFSAVIKHLYNVYKERRND